MSENSRAELRQAADRLDDVRERASDDEAAERLDSLSGQLRKMADGDRGPDHGRLARIQHTIDDIEDDLADSDPDAAGDDLDAALEHVVSYRETVQGV
ncbi:MULTISPECIES: DUF7553 family protein [Halorussus]|uniref:DUF7553 family protein n=1 Tax=Halorussus TaxID=1070314 RepID=UPI00209C9089|nr:hypothetical protein [Halorussus vallis]USZ78029.1 hypothetical protein NGM07_20415 [Halorussus vallis]